MNKNICKMCWNEKWKKDMDNDVRWYELDEIRWSKGIVSCVVNSNFISINNIPDNCIYKLEQLLKS